MAKKNKLKLRWVSKGFELELEGQRSDVEEVLRAATDAEAAVAAAVTAAVGGEKTLPTETRVAAAETAPPTKAKSKRTRTRKKPTPAGSSSTSQGATPVALDFAKDEERFGSPASDWKTKEKAMWLLYMLDELGLGKEFTGKTLSETFNKHYRRYETITTGNVNRDLGTLSTKKPKLVAADTTKADEPWYLTEPGVAHVKELIAKAKSPNGELI